MDFPLQRAEADCGMKSLDCCVSSVTGEAVLTLLCLEFGQ